MCPAYIEKLRIFERKILRISTGKYRSASSDYLHYISNSSLYNISNIERVDIHMLDLVRNHIYRSSLNCTENDNIWQMYYPQQLYFEKTISTGFVPPESFPFLDHNGYIVNDQQIPIIYHINRRPTNKKISHNKANLDDNLMRFNTAINTNIKRKKKKNTYWWLQ